MTYTGCKVFHELFLDFSRLKHGNFVYYQTNQKIIFCEKSPGCSLIPFSNTRCFKKNLLTLITVLFGTYGILNRNLLFTSTNRPFGFFHNT